MVTDSFQSGLADREKIIGDQLLRSQEKEDEARKEIEELKKEQDHLTEEKENILELKKEQD